MEILCLKHINFLFLECRSISVPLTNFFLSQLISYSYIFALFVAFLNNITEQANLLMYLFGVNTMYITCRGLVGDTPLWLQVALNFYSLITEAAKLIYFNLMHVLDSPGYFSMNMLSNLKIIYMNDLLSIMSGKCTKTCIECTSICKK